MTLYIDTRPQLEWVELEYSGDEVADVPLFSIEYKVGKGDGFFLKITDPRAFDKWEFYDTIDQAKAAAQADYEARTAERFRAVEVPKHLPEDNTASLECEYGWNSCVDALMEAILVAHNPRSRGIIDSVTKATLPESLHTKP